MTHKFRTRPLAVAALAATALFATSARADLVELGIIDLGGTGIGAVSTILTIQNSPAESGAVAFSTSGDVITGDAKTGASQTRTWLLGDVGITSAESLRLVFNANEPDGGAITLDDLTFTAYSASGATVFSASLAGPIVYGSTANGTGNSGFLFGLDATQAAAFTTAVTNAGVSFGALYAGLSATASNSDGGNETFFIANADGGPVGAIPEPGTYALLLAGIGAVGFVARRRSRT